MVQIISRAQWGASPWTNAVSSVDPGERVEYMTHYDGATYITRTGYAIPRAIEAEHLGNGWSGIGYHFVVSQAGEIFEGRGWDLQGAHCPNHNRSAIGVQIAVGGDQEPSPAALAASRALYDYACQKYGRQLRKLGHRDGFATDCPGEKLYAWVQAGMPAPSTPEDDMTPDQIASAPIPLVGADGKQSGQTAVLSDYLNGFLLSNGRVEAKLSAMSSTIDTLVQALAKQSPNIDPAQLIQQIKDAINSLDLKLSVQ